MELIWMSAGMVLILVGTAPTGGVSLDRRAGVHPQGAEGHLPPAQGEKPLPRGEQASGVQYSGEN